MSTIETEHPPGDECALEAPHPDSWVGERPRVGEDRLARLQVKIGQMHCSFCVATITKALSRLEGVEDVSVSIAHEEGLVTYAPARVGPQAIVDTLRQVGYSVRDPRKVAGYDEAAAEVRAERDRFQVGLLATVAALTLMSFKWAGHPLHVVWGGHLFLYGPWLILGLAVSMSFVVGRPILKMAIASLRRGIFNQHVLLEAGALGGLVGGMLGLFVAPKVFPAGDFLSVAVFITTYHLLSGYVSSLVRNSASEAVRKLLALAPDTARVIRDGHEIEVPVSEVGLGEAVRVRPGERVPLDGRVLSGASVTDESMVTGEPIPLDKGPGAEVIGGSVNQAGSVVFEVTRVGEDTFLAQVARHMEEARALKPGVIALVERVLVLFVPVVLAAAALSLLVWSIGAWVVTGQVDLGRAIFAALAALVMGYPCALGMSTPLAMMRGGALAAERGILMRSGEAFQVFGGIDVAVLDKTGTLTAGHPVVVDVVPAPGVTNEELLEAAGGAELPSEHPLARAIVAAASERGLHIAEPEWFASETGHGVVVSLGGVEVAAGRPDWLDGRGVSFGVLAERRQAMEEAAQTVVAVARDGELLGLVGIADQIKADAKAALSALRDRGITPVMVTGDNRHTARAVAEAVGIDQVHAQVLPDGKAAIVRDLQRAGHRVVMVGDGINDAPALTQADIGVAIGAGTDIAIESADVVLVGNHLTAVTDARDIGANSYRKTKQNLAIAFGFNGIGVPLAVTGLVAPVWAMVAMVSSVSSVLANSFGARLTGGLATDIARFLARSATSTLSMLGPKRLGRWAFSRRAAMVMCLVAMSFGLGAIWVVALGAPVVGHI